MADIRDHRRHGFFMVDNEVLDSYKNVSVYGVAVYAALCRYAYNDTQKADTPLKVLAEAAHCSINSTRRAIEELIAHELISAEKVNGQVTVYTLLKIKKHPPQAPYQGVIHTVSRRDTVPNQGVIRPNKEYKTNNTTQYSSAEAEGLHTRISKYIQAKHEKRFGIKCQWEGGEGKMLSELLKSNPSWTPDDYQRMVDNRFSSEGIVADRPRTWLSNLGRYTASPLDRFGKSPETNKLSATNRARENAFNEVFGND